MKKHLRLIFLVYAGILFPAMISAQTQCAGKSLLFVGTDPGGLGDSIVRQHLEVDLGLSATYVAPVDLDIGDVLTYDVILISSTISSTDAGMFKDVEVPIVCMESFALDNELLMVQGPAEAGYSTVANVPYIGNNENSFDSLMVLTGDSVKAIGLDAGYGGQTVQVFSEDVPYGSNRHPGQWGVPNENAYKILKYKQETLDLLVTEDLTLCGENGGDFCSNSRFGAFAYPEGVEMGYDGTISPEKRSFFFFHDYSASVSTTEAWDIFDALIYWSMGCLDRPVGTSIKPKVSNLNVDIYPNPASQKVNLRLSSHTNDLYIISLTDIVGVQVFDQCIDLSEERSLKIDLTDTGIFLLNIRNRNNSYSKTFKIISN
jgi:hypothetical protein